MEEQNSHHQQVSEEPEETKRTVIITILCVVFAFSIFKSLQFLLSKDAWQYTKWFSVYASLMTAINIVCTIGIWRMKKWAAYILITFTVIHQIVAYFSLREYNIAEGIITGIVLVVLAIHIDNME